MANIYKNAFYDPASTSPVSVYTVPSVSYRQVALQ